MVNNHSIRLFSQLNKYCKIEGMIPFYFNVWAHFPVEKKFIDN